MQYLHILTVKLKDLSWGHIQTMLTICHTKSFQSFKFLDVEGLSGLPYEGIFNPFYRNHYQVLVGVVTRYSKVPSYRFICILLRPIICWAEKPPCQPVSEWGVVTIPTFPYVSRVKGGTAARFLLAQQEVNSHICAGNIPAYSDFGATEK